MKFKRIHTKERIVCEDETGHYRLNSVVVKYRLLYLFWIPFKWYTILVKEINEG